MDEYGKKHTVYHAIKAGMIPEFDEKTQKEMQQLVNLGAISINFGLKIVTMTNPKMGLENLPDDKIIELLSLTGSVGKQFSNHGWRVVY